MVERMVARSGSLLVDDVPAECVEVGHFFEGRRAKGWNFEKPRISSAIFEKWCLAGLAIKGVDVLLFLLGQQIKSAFPLLSQATGDELRDIAAPESPVQPRVPRNAVLGPFRLAGAGWQSLLRLYPHVCHSETDEQLVQRTWKMSSRWLCSDAGTVHATKAGTT